MKASRLLNMVLVTSLLALSALPTSGQIPEGIDKTLGVPEPDSYAFQSEIAAADDLATLAQRTDFLEDRSTSFGFSAAAATRTNTSPEPGCGADSSPTFNTSTEPKRSYETAFMIRVYGFGSQSRTGPGHTGPTQLDGCHPCDEMPPSLAPTPESASTGWKPVATRQSHRCSAGVPPASMALQIRDALHW